MSNLKNESPLVKCSHCHQIFSSEAFDAHTCDLHLIDQKNIPVINIVDSTHSGKRLMTGWGIDGVLYVFEVVPRKPIPLMEPLNRRILTEDPQKDENDDNLTESIAPLFKL